MKSVFTLNQDEIMEACREYIKLRGIRLRVMSISFGTVNGESFRGALEAKMHMDVAKVEQAASAIAPECGFKEMKPEWKIEQDWKDQQ